MQDVRELHRPDGFELVAVGVQPRSNRRERRVLAATCDREDGAGDLAVDLRIELVGVQRVNADESVVPNVAGQQCLFGGKAGGDGKLGHGTFLAAKRGSRRSDVGTRHRAFAMTSMA